MKRQDEIKTLRMALKSCLMVLEGMPKPHSLMETVAIDSANHALEMGADHG
jgi:hypothetical protein